MRAYIIRRLLLVIPTVFLASLIIFIIIRLIPGSIVETLIGEVQAYSTTPIEEVRATILHKLGMDVPLLEQFGRWIWAIIAHGDFGLSIWNEAPVTDRILSALPISLEVGFLAVIISQLISLPIGIFSALRQDTWGDYIARSFAIILISVPSFWMATMILVFPAIWWGYMPSMELIPFAKDPIGHLVQFIVPAAVLGMAMSGVTMRMTRTMMLEVLRQDYIRTAWAKGLKERVVIIRHALKNALIPVITIIGMQMGIVFGGTVIIEQIFCLPGIGRLLFQATNYRDYTIVSGVMFFFAIALVLINLIVDLTYKFLDPRLKYQ